MKLLGIKVADAGYQPKKSEMSVPMPADDKEPEKRYPTIYVDDQELPAIKSKDLKDDCIMVCKVHVKRREESETTDADGKKQTRVTCTLEIHQAGFVPYRNGKAPADMTDEELEKAVEEKD